MEKDAESNRTQAAEVGIDKETAGDEVATGEHEAETRQNIVDWEGDDDEEKPQNWGNGRKARNIVVICYNTFLTYVPFFPCGSLPVPQVLPDAG